MGYEDLTPLTADEIQRVATKTPEAGYPPLEDRLIIARSAWDVMVEAGRIVIEDDPKYHITDYPNRLRAMDAGAPIAPIATVDNPMNPEQVAHWQSLGLLVDTAGRPLHPRAPELLPITGMFTGPGWSYRYGPQITGNLGLRRVRSGRVEYAAVAVLRGEVIWWGLPGGYPEAGEGPRDTALREGSEESGVDLRDKAYLLSIGGVAMEDVRARLKYSLKDTLHAWLEEAFTFVHSPGNPALEGVEFGESDTEVLAKGWIDLDEIVARDDFLDTHQKMIKAHEGVE